MRIHLILPAAAIAVAAPTQSAVTGANDHGFDLRHEVMLAMPPAHAWARFGQVQRWWSKDHTYSGDAANLRLALVPGGCFCERLPGGGGIEHLRVTYVDPGKRAVLTGALGPLLYDGVAGSLDVTFKPDRGGTRIIVSYRAAGFARANAKAMAPLVDQVLGEQVARLGGSVRL